MLLYAEHLFNIRAISIQAVLPSPSNKETCATISTDGSSLTLAHNGHVASIKLPAAVPKGRTTAALPIPEAPCESLSFRVQLQQDTLADGSQEVESIVPWTAAALNADTELSCMHCQQIVLARGKVLTWKNLPSENWAEMMDFWHCHRPHVAHDHDRDPPTKGYSVDSTLALNPGIGMVDPVDFVLASKDCGNLKITSSHNSQNKEVGQLECVSCSTVLGHVHTSGGYKLRKLHLAATSAIDQPSRSYEAEKWWSCLLLSSIECQGVRKFTIQDSRNGTRSLRLWVFTPDMTVSSSAMTSPEPMRAVKVFWQDCEMSFQDSGALNRNTLAEGELELPAGETQELRAKLVMSAAILPDSARTFQGWNVALLPRFTPADLRS